ncbi:MAG: hypothetical protein CMJ80_17815, partial [Planctomycetaceae bacterium]|nr:hypothetical protein [Planctomycetaceae bacterium]
MNFPAQFYRAVALFFVAFGSLAVVLEASAEDSVKLRVATFNTSLNRCLNGRSSPCLSDGLKQALVNPDFLQAQRIAETIQRIAPDVVLLNEFNYDTDGSAADLFQSNFLSIGQNVSDHPDGPALPIEYPFRYLAPSNTGISSGFDLDNNGRVDTTPGDIPYGNDSLGFGEFEGRYGMLLLSKFPIQQDKVRTFQKFLWKDMPDAVLPDDRQTATKQDWYSEAELAVFRLSSKSHWDVPIQMGGQVIHILASHPTPPVFDGAEDRNGRRNHDEIRLWADYITPHKSGYLVDDEGRSGGLDADTSFVILGDLNADPNRGDQFGNAIQQLLEHPRVNVEKIPVNEKFWTGTAEFRLRA